MLIPIRARTLRRPCSSAASRRSSAVPGWSSSCPREPAIARTTSMACQGWTASAPAGEQHRHRVHVERVAGLHEEVAGVPPTGVDEGGVDRADGEEAGTGTRPGPASRSLSTRRSAPRSRARSASSTRRPRALARPAGPFDAGQVASRVTIRQGAEPPGPWRSRPASAARAAVPTIGPGSWTQRGAPRRTESSRRGRGPIGTSRLITTRSRSGSIGGFVTWAKAWRR